MSTREVIVVSPPDWEPDAHGHLGELRQTYEVHDPIFNQQVASPFCREGETPLNILGTVLKSELCP